MIGVALASEDRLSEAVGERLLGDAGELRIDFRLRKQGAGYLQSRIPNFKKMALNGQPVVLFTDLDDKPCAAELVRDWLGQAKQPGNLLIRVAVREVESWLLADHIGMRELLDKQCKLPNAPDELKNPKNELLNLARGARSSIRDEIVRAEGAIARQSLNYNSFVGEFALTRWSPSRAEHRSPSLRRARKRIDELARRIRDA